MSNTPESDLKIPNGTYPENRLIDGALGSSEDVALLQDSDGFVPGPESNLDFQVSIPLIWPQKTVLFQTDDEYYEENSGNGFFNSMLNHELDCSLVTPKLKALKRSSMRSTAATATSQRMVRPAIVPTKTARTPSTLTPIRPKATMGPFNAASMSPPT